MVAPFESDLELEDNSLEFGDPTSSSYPKLAELCGHLVHMRVVKIDENHPKFRGKPGEVQARAYVDVIVIDGPAGSEVPFPSEYDEMWIDREPLIKQMKPFFKKGSAIVGVLRRFPSSNDIAAKYPTPDDVETAFINGKIQMMDTCWKLEKATDEQKALVVKYLKDKKANLFS